VSSSRLPSVARWSIDAAVLALALFALANLLRGALAGRWDANALWVRGGALPAWLVQPLAAAFALGVLRLRHLPARGARVVRGLALVLATACLADALDDCRLLARGALRSHLPLPLSLLLAALLVVWALLGPAPGRERGAHTRRALWVSVLGRTAPVWLGALGLLLHLLTFGAGDYARPADAAVVFGAAVRADGRPSQAPRDRTLSACDLSRRGLVRVLVLSGGRDPAAPLSEPACMARLGRAAGVPASALVLDEGGANTAATVRDAAHLAAARG
jgi:hypothetical protein